MELIRNIDNLRRDQKKCVLSIGNFDGIHRGHQAIIKQLKELANEHNLATAIVTFEPQPQEYFSLEAVSLRLTRFRDKIVELHRLGIDCLICLKFNQVLANLSAREFIQQLVVDGLDGRHLVVGDDFRFGKDRQGDYLSLQQMAKEFGFGLHSAKTVLFENARISSTRIRQALKEGDLKLVKQLLGRQYTISGRVVDGDKRGRILGFPTANIDLNRYCSPLTGVYVTRVHMMAGYDQPEENSYEAVTSIGTRPMFDGQGLRLETHILDFNETLYGRYIVVEFLQRVRSEKKFPTLDDMIKMMQADVENVRRYFSVSQ